MAQSEPKALTAYKAAFLNRLKVDNGIINKEFMDAFAVMKVKRKAALAAGVSKERLHNVENEIMAKYFVLG